MASTDKFDLTGDEWTQVSTDETSVAIQLASKGTVLVHIGEAAPAEDAAGIVIGNEAVTPRDFSVSGVPDGASVWAKAQDEDVSVIVMKY